MKDHGYINIQGWMINKLQLKGNELILFALIYGFSQDNKSEFYGSLSYIQSALKISKPTAQRLIAKLIDQNFIKRTDESKYKIHNRVIKMITASDSGVIKMITGGYQNDNNTVIKTLPNNNTNNKNNNTSEETSPTVNEVIEIMKPINELAYTRWFANKTQRKAVETLIKNFDLETIKSDVSTVLKYRHKDKPYSFPSINTPVQFVDKYQMMVKWIKDYKKLTN